MGQDRHGDGLAPTKKTTQAIAKRLRTISTSSEDDDNYILTEMENDVGSDDHSAG